MNSNFLPLPFRRSHTVSLAQAIKQYISTKYDQHPDMFTKDLATIDSLRDAAVNSLDPHFSGIRKLQAYAAQLVWIGGKFPIDNQIGIEFPWYPAFGNTTAFGNNVTQRPISQNNLRFELANILWNLAALYAQLAFSSNRSTPDGLRAASNYFCLSAGVLSYLRTDIIPELRSTPPEDMDTMTLQSLESLMLAQAQECFWAKAVSDGLKDASIAKLAAKVSDLYADAQDFGAKTESIESDWLHHMTAKHHHFAAAAQYRAACDCLEKRKYGEEVARLRDSLLCVSEALKEAKYINKTVLGDLNGLKSRVQEDLKRAEKDNDMIYLIPEPPKSELKTLDRAMMVSAKIPPQIKDPMSTLGDNGELGQPLFTKLVPYAVHVAASIYEDRRDRLVKNSIIDEMEAMTGKIREVLKSLNLPGSLQALEKPLGLPPGLVSHAEEIRQQDGPNRLVKSINETEKLKDNDRNIYQEGVELLRSEAAEDDRARIKYGTERWSRPVAKDANPKLHAQIAEIDNYLKSAASSDETVYKKFRDSESLIRLLGGNDRDLEHYVPSSRRAVLTPAVDQASSRLRACLNDISRLESRRARKIESLIAKIKQDDINPELLREAARLERDFPMQKIEAGQFEDFFERRLVAKFEVDKGMVAEEEREQQALIKRLQDTNAAFSAARRGDESTKQREKALQSLENAYFKYKEIITNLEAGRKFYNDLARIVTRFRDDCRAFAYSRRSEAGLIESDITTSMSGLSLNKATTSLQQQKDAESQRPSYPAPAPVDEPLAAPQPKRTPVSVPPAGMWTPDMGIKFAPPGQPNAPPAKENGKWDPSKGMRFS
ncbi:putative pH signal transduction protein pala [Tothia fuscella]|uniref:PH signal transduction protein pala n=1 Tax=Tothia fuscella TaxID=1048955 RepID=A0A9P4TT82_9PEZI|nr:putative pH signal transduction protein pala [Tothia fuscella]